MADEEQRPGDSGEPTQPEQPIPTPTMIDSPNAPSSHSEPEPDRKQMTGFERATLKLTIAAVGISALAAIFVCLQWWEMHKGGDDTKALAVAAGNQAKATQTLAENSRIQTSKTEELARQMKLQASETKKIASEAVKQAETAQRQLSAFEDSQAANLVVSPFVASHPVEAGKQVQLQCNITNDGGSPAEDIWIEEEKTGGDASPWIQRSKAQGTVGKIAFDIPIQVSAEPHPAEPGLGETLGAHQTRDCSESLGPFDSGTIDGKAYYYVRLAVNYRDVFGRAYVRNECLVLGPKKSFYPCHTTTTPIRPN